MTEAADHAPLVPLAFERISLDESQVRADAFYDRMQRRRTTRHFAREKVPAELIRVAVRTAGTAPSGANLQPWTFVAVSDPEIKAQIRRAAEAEERARLEQAAAPDLQAALAALGDDAEKPHFTDAPWLVVLFRHTYGIRPDGEKRTYYYTQESCGIAAGLFIAAIHAMGLVTLTHTPKPASFIGELLQRPPNEKAMLIMPVGYPGTYACVPEITRKPIEDILVWK